MVAHTHCHRRCAAGDHIAAHKSDVGVVGYALLPVVDVGRLFYRLTLSGETGLADKQVLCLQNANIGGDHIPRGQVDNVPHHQVIHGDLHLLLSLPGNGTGGGDHGQQLFCRIAAPGLLDKAQGPGEDDHGQDNHHRQAVKILRHASKQRQIGKHHVRHGGYQGQAEQNRRKGIDKGAGQPLGQGFLFFPGHFVAAVLIAVFQHGLCVQTTQSGIHLTQNILCGVGGRILDAAVLLVTDHCLLNVLAKGNALFFLVHRSYLLAFS